ncbi:hypothetical protein K432DRAFT_376718 [Lepidopterella palustris CBS 459.81]|uniref:Uncharacterized protein n=1 Tax=Lepidopterella palustris CBS 459.81 TaxID=1314670 RepID=A0A8E2EMU5_9PEZI|nr:hypothetical protein K432DRAFT_376718 [Lepidopterella palustris CBS 459.81]
MYLTLSSLQALTSFSWPAVIIPLRSGMTTAMAILHCEDCPKEAYSAIQNVVTLTALLTALAERFCRALQAIDADAKKLEQSGQKKDMRIGDNSLENLHLHTGGVDCHMSFNIELGAEDWRKLAKKAVRTEVWGNGSNPTPLIRVVEQMELRQERWHAHNSGQMERGHIFGNCGGLVPSEQQPDRTCLRMVNLVRKMIDTMDWT